MLTPKLTPIYAMLTPQVEKQMCDYKFSPAEVILRGCIAIGKTYESENIAVLNYRKIELADDN